MRRVQMGRVHDQVVIQRVAPIGLKEPGEYPGMGGIVALDLAAGFRLADAETAHHLLHSRLHRRTDPQRHDLRD